MNTPAAIAALTVITPHITIPAAQSTPTLPAQKERTRMNDLYVHIRPGEPTARLNHHDPARPFAVIDFDGGSYLTTEDPAWCRRVAAAWTHAAELLESAAEHSPRRTSDARSHGPARHVAQQACPP